MRVRVLLFAGLREVVGKRCVEIEVPEGGSVEDVREAVGAAWPAVRSGLRTAVIAVNLEYAGAGQQVHAEDEVAFIPPVSGGCG